MKDNFKDGVEHCLPRQVAIGELAFITLIEAFYGHENSSKFAFPMDNTEFLSPSGRKVSKNKGDNIAQWSKALF